MKLRPYQSAFMIALGAAILVPVLKFVYGGTPDFLLDSILTPIGIGFGAWLGMLTFKPKHK